MSDSQNRDHRSFINLGIAVAAGLVALAALLMLSTSTMGLRITATHVGTTPVTVFSPASAEKAPVVVIAHGFAGSQQLMAPFATTLAHAGMIAVTFDFLGHGRNPRPLTGSITELDGATKSLMAELGEVVAFARTLPNSNGQVAVVGHSMASDIVVRYAQSDPAVLASVAVSMFSPAVTATTPRNLLVVVGAWEPGLRDEALRVITLATPDARAGLTYGDFNNGTARRAEIAPGVEHVSVLYSHAALATTKAWLEDAFGRQRLAGDEFVDSRGIWIALLFLSLTLLGRPLSRLLPVVASRPLGAGLPWRRLLPVAVAPMLLTPLVLWKAPTEFLPILVGDYLAAHFAVYGLITAVALSIATRAAAPEAPRIAWPSFITSTMAVAFYSIAVFGFFIDRFVTSFVPVEGRFALIAAMLIGTIPYFLSDEWLTRGLNAPRGSYAFTKLCFLASLAIAVALSFEKLFFLVIIVPVILLFFIIYGLFSGWVYRQTNFPLVGGCANALAFAWAIAVTFPLLSR